MESFVRFIDSRSSLELPIHLERYAVEVDEWRRQALEARRTKRMTERVSPGVNA
jgi:hypothetical protein